MTAPRALLAAATALCALGVPAPSGAQTNDPRQVFRTYETAHLRVHYYQGLEHVARRVAHAGEAVFARVGDLVGNRPVDVTEVLLTDRTDFANGSAIAVPFNTVRLNVTAPDDLSTLGDGDDWLRLLTTHELTHIAHTDNISGAPWLLNQLLGKVYPPNNLQPPFVLEGIAVYAESGFTTGGRLRSSVWDMYLRGEALRPEGMASLDQVSNLVNRWPHGDIYYLYGSYFVRYLVERFGEGVLARLADDYGAQPIPGAMNRSLARATGGHTFESLYPEFVAHTRARYEAQRAAIERAGRREGVPLTEHGEEVLYPRFLSDRRTVLYQSYDGRSHAMFRSVDAAPNALDGRAHDGPWVQYLAGYALSPDERRAYVSDVGFHRGIYAYHELYERSLERRADGSVALDEAGAVQLTEGARVRYPDAHPDDDHLTFVVNHHGTQLLYEFSRREGRMVQLLRSARFEQAYTPRYAPDGRSIVFSHWRSGGYRDVRLYDRETGSVRDLTHDRAQDLQPVFSPDGRYVLFSSDRTGVHNLYAIELATGVQRQLTNVLYGAFMPAVSPDGRWLVYVGYHPRGFDLYRMAFEPERAPELDLSRERLDGGALGTTRVASTRDEPHTPAGRDRPYEPLQTLGPRTWFASLDDDGFGPRVTVGTQGRDIVGNHAWSAAANVGLVNPEPGFALAYSYGGLRPTMRVELYRAVGRASWRVGRSDPAFPQARWGGAVDLSVRAPVRFGAHSFGLRYDAQYIDAVGGLPFASFVDPSEPPPRAPAQGFFASLRATWRFSRVQRYTYDISAHEGFNAVVSARASDPVLGSLSRSADVTFAVEGFLPLPLAVDRRAHVLALRLAGGLALNDAPRANYFVGGFPAFGFSDLLSVLANLGVGTGVALRGYPEAARRGDRYVLGNAEYRFPIAQVDRGVLTLPVFLRRLYGAVFVDLGSAFTGGRFVEQFALGTGGEILADLLLGYYWDFTARLGVARGFVGRDATFQGYLSLSAPF